MENPSQQLTEQIRAALETDFTAAGGSDETQESSLALETGENLTLIWNRYETKTIIDLSHQEAGLDDDFRTRLGERMLRLNASERLVSDIVFSFDADGGASIATTLNGSDNDHISGVLENLFAARRDLLAGVQSTGRPENTESEEEQKWTRI